MSVGSGRGESVDAKRRRGEDIAVAVGELTVCAECHAVGVRPTEQDGVVFQHACGRFTWRDGNYCVGCGEAIR